jgi:hypothetical protein
MPGKQHKEDQKKKPQKANSATVAAAAATVVNPHFAALMPTLVDLEEWWFKPAGMYHALLACMAGPINTGQHIATHLFLHLNPIIIFKLTFLATPRDPMSLQVLATTISMMVVLHLHVHTCSIQQKRVKRYKKPVRVNQEKDKTASKLRP